MTTSECSNVREKSTVGIVIVNYKTSELAIECIRSLNNERESNRFKIIIVDNDSQDNSFEEMTSAVLSEGWEGWVKVQSSGFNGGFSFGNNFAIKQFMKKKKSPDFIYLLNPDTVVYDNAIKNLVSFLVEHPEVGIAGSRIEDGDGSPVHSSFRFHSWITELNRGFSLGILTRLLKPWISSDIIPDRPEKADWVSGASMMIRSAMFEDIGLLDESYFMYFEETDFCLRTLRSGWECWYVPSSKVVHFVGQSSGINNTGMTKRMPQYWFDSRRRYFLKNYGVIHTIAADFCWLIGFSSWKLRNILQRKEDNHPPRLLRDFFRNSIFVKGISVAPNKVE
ncbi:MAG: glycosyltransferase family 2 protein [Methylophaga sp.]|nr:glycosyltransferase family 2 protein [Methylophaga sp.]